MPEQHWEAGRELRGGWRELRDRIPDMEIRIQLSRLFRYFALHDIAPDQVSAATFAAFRVWLEQRTTVIDPAGRFRRTCLAWNRAAAAVPGWPPVCAPVDAPRTKQYVTPEALPASFRAEVETWRQLLAGDDLFAASAPKRPLRPASIEHMVGTVYRFASGMIRQGVPAAELGSMADLFTRKRFAARSAVPAGPAWWRAVARHHPDDRCPAGYRPQVGADGRRQQRVERTSAATSR